MMKKRNKLTKKQMDSLKKELEKHHLLYTKTLHKRISKLDEEQYNEVNSFLIDYRHRYQERVTIRLSREQLRFLKNDSKMIGLDQSAYIRRLIKLEMDTEVLRQKEDAKQTSADNPKKR